MIKFWRVTAYMFLALCGVYVWINVQEGWKHYLGLAIFVLATIRIMAQVLPSGKAGPDDAAKEKAGSSRPDKDKTPDTK